MEAKGSLLPCVLLLLSHLVHAATIAAAAPSQQAAPLAPAVIAFGDSIMDPGNNNAIPTIARSNFPPYGMDFDGGEPTGRFCNGRIPPDFIASRLGVKELLPAYLGMALNPEDILTGVSFASAGTGYDPLTSKVLSVIPMLDQLNLFREYKEKLITIAGVDRAAAIVSRSLYLVCAGSNDVANTYFTLGLRSPYYDIPSYVDLIVTFASNFLQQLSQLGARTIGFVGLPPLGCVPSQRTLAGGIQRDCDPARNQAALLYNSKMRLEIEKLTRKLHGTKIVFLDIYPTLLDLITRPSDYGFEEASKGCCGTGEFELSFLCNSKTTLTCVDDTKYVFWDSFHPTERTYEIMVDKLLKRYLHDLF